MINQEFIKSEIYKDIGDYKNLSLLALSKKLPYWKKVFNKKISSDLDKIYHLRNYCRDCDKERIFIHSKYRTFDGHYKPWTLPDELFWKYYREQFKNLYLETEKYYLETSKANEEVRCPCGGHYTSSHRAKHFKTKKHLKFESII